MKKIAYRLQVTGFSGILPAASCQLPARAFTLIETMVAVTILTLAVTGALFTASRAIVAAQTARAQLTASYLAQEGAEYVRAVRDNEYLTAYQAGGSNVSTVAWSNFLAGAINQCRTAECSLDLTRPMGYGSGSSLFRCTGEECKLYLLASGVYATERSGQSGSVTPFVRTVQVIDVSSSDERIVSKVSWSFHEIPYSVTVTDHLTPWQ